MTAISHTNFDRLFHKGRAADNAKKAAELEIALVECEITRDLIAKTPDLEAALRKAIAGYLEAAEYHRGMFRQYRAMWAGA